MAKISGKNIGDIPGTIKTWSSASAPNGYLACDGTPISRTTYAALFSKIGTTYGSGDGSTTFNLPDYRWAFLRGYGANISANGSGSASSNQATFTNHGFNRTGVKLRLSSGTLSGLSVSTDYWVIVVDINTLAFATSKANAIANTRISISGANSAVIVQYEDPDAASRVSNTNGANSGANVGSVQDDQLNSHKHLTDTYERAASGNYFNAFGTDGTVHANGHEANQSYGIPTSSYVYTSPNGGNETRPKNAYVNYIIKT